jgi:hypothetical protein
MTIKRLRGFKKINAYDKKAAKYAYDGGKR